MSKRTARPAVSDEDALLLAIAASPADDLPRLVYCDWLDENGRSEQANFIRWQLRSPYYHLPTRVLRLGVDRPRRGRAVPGCHSSATKLLDCIRHLPWENSRFHEWPASGTSVAVRNRGGSCGVVWRRGFIAAVWASYVSFTRPVLEALRKHPLEIFHYYGDIPGSSRVPNQDTVNGITTATVEYRWHTFRTTRKFQYAGEQYEFGNLRYAPEYSLAFYPAVDLCFREALKHYFPGLTGLMVMRPTADQYVAYNHNFYPGAGCPTPFDGVGPVELNADEPVRRLHVLSPAGGVPDQPGG